MENLDIRDLIKKKKQELLHQIKLLKADLIEVRLLEKTLSERTKKFATEQELRKKGNMTFQDMILDVLSEKPEGARATEILFLIEQKFNVKIERSSISPQLSRLKDKKHKLELVNGLWRTINASNF